jgi:hypothetical protein
MVLGIRPIAVLWLRAPDHAGWRTIPAVKRYLSGRKLTPANVSLRRASPTEAALYQTRAVAAFEGGEVVHAELDDIIVPLG